LEQLKEEQKQRAEEGNGDFSWRREEILASVGDLGEIYPWKATS